jgi:hypothetical protein
MNEGDLDGLRREVFGGSDVVPRGGIARLEGVAIVASGTSYEKSAVFCEIWVGPVQTSLDSIRELNKMTVVIEVLPFRHAPLARQD